MKLSELLALIEEEIDAFGDRQLVIWLEELDDDDPVVQELRKCLG